MMAAKKERWLRLLARLTPQSVVMEVEEHVGHKVLMSHYHVERVRADFGAGIVFKKASDGWKTQYAVNIDGDRESCECMGFLAHAKCKHVAAARALLNNGKLKPPVEIQS